MAKFTKIPTTISGLFIIKSTVFGDDRGFFMETWNKRDFEEIGINMVFLQDNHSKSKRGVLRGIHFQEKCQQGKLVRCLKGKVLDIAVDLRENSKTFGEHYKVILSEKNQKQLLIPQGFGHAFLSLEEGSELVYKASNYYSSEFDSGILYNDEDIKIKWNFREYGLNDIILSQKDKRLPTLKEWIKKRGNKGL